MLDKTDDISVAADNWLVQFEDALAGPDDVLLKPLFHPESYWRDVLALSWNIQTVNRAFAIIEELPAHARRSTPHDFRIDAERAPPRRVMRAGTDAIEAIFKFETAVGRGHGIVRLIPDAADGDRLKAWTLLTALEELKGFEEQQGNTRPRGQAYSRDFRGPNWLDLRKASAEYAGRDPDVLVVGGGQAGLAIAARLQQLKIDALIVDREASATIGASATTRSPCTTRCRSIICPTCRSRRTGRPTSRRTSSPTGSNPMSMPWS